ncbi:MULTISPECIES: histidine ammonia-lyase [Cysteiniphilum]|uniref:histidine ammonia-lyase n=1 Tax=Cysteiniphilum TaxID=2056696 RepID=UPI001CE2B5ED|nr:MULTISPECIES: histidine ammonia-lyase [Cysteiniphilum]
MSEVMNHANTNNNKELNPQSFCLIPGELSLQDIELLITSACPIHLDDRAYAKVATSRSIVEEVLSAGKTVYGINTGFGLLANKKIPTADLKELQRRIVLSHATGVGKPLDNDTVKLIMLLKINSLAQGYSGVTQQTLDALIAFYNHGIYPVIPEQGSVGASGDLAPLAHMSMPLIGEGDVSYQGQRISAQDALKQAGLSAIKLQEKEGLALLNGTQASTAIALMGLIKVERNFSIATIAGALSIEATFGSMKPFDPVISQIKRVEGQIIFSQVMRNLLENSEIMHSHDHCDKVQDPYSLRCQPQVMGAAWQVINDAKRNLLNEANGVSDNPLILPETKEIISGGNFHAEMVAMSADMLSIACAEIGAISERRIALLIDKHLSGLPAFLIENAGLNSGFMLAHVTASSLASENKTLAHPASVDSLPTSANQEDHVSMATFAARKLNTIAQNVLSILSIEVLAACQGVSLRAPLKTSNLLDNKYRQIRAKIPYYDEDRYFARDIENATDVIKQHAFYSDVHTQLFQA